MAKIPKLSGAIPYFTGNTVIVIFNIEYGVRKSRKPAYIINNMHLMSLVITSEKTKKNN